MNQLSHEVRQKLAIVRPETLVRRSYYGIAVLIIYPS